MASRSSLSKLTRWETYLHNGDSDSNHSSRSEFHRAHHPRTGPRNLSNAMLVGTVTVDENGELEFTASDGTPVQ